MVRGGCHCRAVRFEATVDDGTDVLDCRCSICSLTGFLHLIVPHEDFRLVSGSDALASYRFGTRTAEHLFCKICGIKSFYQPRSHPGSFSIHFNALDPGHGLTSRVVVFDAWDDEAR